MCFRAYANTTYTTRASPSNEHTRPLTAFEASVTVARNIGTVYVTREEFKSSLAKAHVSASHAERMLQSVWFTPEALERLEPTTRSWRTKNLNSLEKDDTEKAPLLDTEGPLSPDEALIALNELSRQMAALLARVSATQRTRETRPDRGDGSDEAEFALPGVPGTT